MPFLDAFHQLFDADDLWAAARHLGVVERQRKLDVPALVQATVLSLSGPPGAQTSIFATYLQLSGKRVGTSAFYDWFDADFMRLMAQLAARATAAVRAVEPAPDAPAGSLLAQLGDVRVVDASSILLGKLAAAWAPSTAKTRGGIKLHGVVALDSPAPHDLQVTAQHVHDTRAFDEAALPAGTLLLYDLGYVDHAREVRLLRRRVDLLRRLKTTENPRIVAVHRGLGDAAACVGRTLNDALDADLLRLGDTLDLDVTLRGDDGATATVRVVGVVGPDGATRWYLTSLGRDRLTAEEIAEAYALRWVIELVWKAFKTGLGVDRIRAWRPSAVGVLVHAKVIAMALARLLQLSTQPACGPHAVTQLAIVLTLTRLSSTLTGLLMLRQGLDVAEMERRLLLIAATLGKSRRQRRERAKRERLQKSRGRTV